jgi:HD-GYP domain-containing protein (c-di-GMP phosphodiesterase class II)
MNQLLPNFLKRRPFWVGLAVVAAPSLVLLALADGAVGLYSLHSAQSTLTTHNRALAPLQQIRDRAGRLYEDPSEAAKIVEETRLLNDTALTRAAMQASMQASRGAVSELTQRDLLNESARAIEVNLQSSKDAYEAVLRHEQVVEDALLKAGAAACFSILISGLAAFRLTRKAKTSAAASSSSRLMSNAPVGIFIWEADEVQTANGVFSACLGIGADELSNALDLSIRATDLAELKTALHDTSKGLTREPLVCRALNDRGGQRMLQFHLSPFEAGSKAVLGFAIDLTNEKNALETAVLKTQQLDSKNAMLEKALVELEESMEAIVLSLVKAVEAKDPYTAGHSQRVSDFAVKLGAELGLAAYELKLLEVGMLVHDVGKIGIPDAILTNPGRLTPEEFEVIKTHPAVGAEIIGKTPLSAPCLPIVRWHHEKLDGTGYPDGLVGEDIPYLARIAAVADIFDAITTKRSYRQAIPLEEAMRIIEREAGEGKLDFSVVNALRRCVRSGAIRPAHEEENQHEAA